MQLLQHSSGGLLRLFRPGWQDLDCCCSVQGWDGRQGTQEAPGELRGAPVFEAKLLSMSLAVELIKTERYVWSETIGADSQAEILATRITGAQLVSTW